MKNIAMLIVGLFAFCSCNDTDTPQKMQQSQIIAVTSYEGKAKTIEEEQTESKLLFTGNDIAWFNTTSREIKFSTIKTEPFSIPPYAHIDIKIENETLFSIVAHINASADRAYDDLVLFYDLKTSKYYLYDNYPNYWSPVSTKQNAQKRASGWNKFLKQLSKEGRLQ